MVNLFFINKLIDKKAEKRLFECEKSLESFFKIKINNVNVFFLKSRKELDNIYGRKTEDWLTAFAGFGSIFILDPKIYTRQSSHKDINEFWQTLKHEYCHLFYYFLTKNPKPQWLNEGLACYLADQNKYNKNDKNIMKIFDYYDKSDKNIFSIGYFWVKQLIEKFGEKKLLMLLQLLKNCSNEKDFKRLFFNVYNINYNQEGFYEILKLVK